MGIDLNRWWQFVLALAAGSGVGLGLHRWLIAVFGREGSAISMSTVTVSSLLGGFCGVVSWWIVTQVTLTQHAQSLLLFALLGVMASVAAQAAAEQPAIAAADVERLRRRAWIHVCVGVTAALVCIALIEAVLYIYRSTISK